MTRGILMAGVAVALVGSAGAQVLKVPDYHQYYAAAWKASADWPAPARIGLKAQMAGTGPHYTVDPVQMDYWRQAFEGAVALTRNPQGASPAEVARLQARIEPAAIQALDRPWCWR